MEGINMKVYLSHSIRGKYGNNATALQMKANCNAIIRVGEQIRETIPRLDLYIPAESEEFVAIALKKEYISIDEILDVDCTIIDNCDAVIVYIPDGDVLQGGRLIEYNHAIKTKKPVYVFSEVEQAIGYLTKLILQG